MPKPTSLRKIIASLNNTFPFVAEYHNVGHPAHGIRRTFIGRAHPGFMEYTSTDTFGDLGGTQGNPNIGWKLIGAEDSAETKENYKVPKDLQVEPRRVMDTKLKFLEMLQDEKEKEYA